MTFNYRLTTQKKYKNTRVRYDLEKVKEPIIKEAYHKELQSHFAPLMLLNSLQEINNEFTTIINETTSNLLGKVQETRRPWIPTTVLEKCDIQREAKKQRFKDDEYLQNYKKVNK